MLIRMLVSVAGPEFSVMPGEETDRFSDDEAQRFIAAGVALPVGAPTVETAAKSMAAAETRKGRAKG